MVLKQFFSSEKFILSVSIIADIEHCPQTPPPESSDWPEDPVGRGAGNNTHTYTQQQMGQGAAPTQRHVTYNDREQNYGEHHALTASLIT